MINAPILRTISSVILSFVLVFAVYLLLRGQNSPGGGFIAGVLVAAVVALQCVAFDLNRVRRLFPVDHLKVAGAGLLLAASTGIGATILGQPFLTSTFRFFQVPFLGEVEIASAMFFDFGVFFVVLGAIGCIVSALGEG